MKRTGNADKPLSDAISKAFHEHMRKISSHGSYLDFMKHLVRLLYIDGEAFLIQGKNNRLKFICPTLCPYNYCDPTQNIYNGIKYDENDQPETYFFYDQQKAEHTSGNLPAFLSQINTGNSVDLIELPAAEVHHIFKKIHTNQRRGITPVASVLPIAHQLQMIQEHVTEIIRFSAQNTKILEDTSTVKNEKFGDSGPSVIEIESGSLIELGANQKVVDGFTMDFPDKTYGKLYSSYTSEIAAAFGVTPQTFLRDMSKTNFSSNRAGMAYDRETYRDYHQMLFKFLVGIYHSWLPNALANGEIKTVTGRSFPLSISIIDKLENPTMIVREYESLMPAQDATAQKTLLAAGLVTEKELLSRRGIDYEEHILQLKIEAKNRKIIQELQDTENAGS